MKYNNKIADKLFLKSALCTNGQYMSTEDVVYWLNVQNNKIEVKISQCPLQEMDGWSFNYNGSIKHKSGKFFSIEGVEVETTCPVYKKWQQPIINTELPRLVEEVARSHAAEGLEPQPQPYSKEHGYIPGCCCLPFWAGMFQFSSVKLLPTPMQIQKDKKAPRFFRQ